MVGDRLVITSRGRPKDTFEQCCSFLMIMKADISEGLIKGFDKDFSFVKLDPVVYPQLITPPHVKMGGGSNYYCQFAVV
jgi:hypothetical protein